MKKNPSRSSSTKPRRSKSSLNRLQRKQRRNQSSNEFDYQNLEPRYALDASFTYNNGLDTLDLSAFTNDVTISNDGTTADIVINGDTLTLPSNLLSSVSATLEENVLTFGGSSTFAGGQSVAIDNFAAINQTGPLVLETLSIVGENGVSLENPGNRLSTLDVDVVPDGDPTISVFSQTSLSGDVFSGGSLRIETGDAANLADVVYDQINPLSDVEIITTGNLSVSNDIVSPVILEMRTLLL